MASTFSPSLRLELIASGSQSGVWGVTTNNNLGDLIEQAISGATDLDVTLSDITLTALNGVVDQSRSAVLSIIGTAGTTRTVTIPNVSKTYTVKNRSDATVNIKTLTGVAFAVPTLAEAYIYCGGNDVVTGRAITDAANTFTSNTNPLNNTTLTGVPIAPTAPAGTNNTQIATTAFVNTALPVGSVIMWYGLLANIPTGWQICDGTNGTPDMRDRFPVGAGTSYALNDTGGANSVTLDVTQIPSHAHTGSASTVNLAHTHTFSASTSDVDLSHDHTGSTGTVDLAHTHSGTTGNNSVGHDHGFSASTSAVDLTHSHTGSASTAGDHSHPISDPGHAHTVTIRAEGGSQPGILNSSYLGYADPFTTSTATTGISINSAGSHSHTLAIGNALGAHSHSVSGTTGGVSANHNHAFTTGAMSANATHSHTLSINNALGSHAHTVSGTTSAMSANETHSHTITIGNAGGGLAHENRPPYLAMYFIMRV